MHASVKRLEATKFVAHSGSGHKVVTDGNNGDSAPGPMEVVLMAAESCSSVDVVSILKKTRQDVRS